MYCLVIFPVVLHGSLLAGKIFLTPSNKLVGHILMRHKARKEETSFILNGGATVQGEGHKDYGVLRSLTGLVVRRCKQILSMHSCFYSRNIGDLYMVNKNILIFIQFNIYFPSIFHFIIHIWLHNCVDLSFFIL